MLEGSDQVKSSWSWPAFMLSRCLCCGSGAVMQRAPPPTSNSMAECIAGKQLPNKEVFTVGHTSVGSYFDGVGLAGSADLPGFVEYVSNGAIAIRYQGRCVEAYEFIVDHFTADSEVWVLGLSRGAFTVRSVAGMINNFGIVDGGRSTESSSLTISALSLPHVSEPRQRVPPHCSIPRRVQGRVLRAAH